MTAEEAAAFIAPGDHIGMSGSPVSVIRRRRRPLTERR